MLVILIVFIVAIALSFLLSLNKRKYQIKREFTYILKRIKNDSNEKVPDFKLSQKEDQEKCFEFIIDFYSKHKQYFNEDIYNRIARVGHPQNSHPDSYTFMLEILDREEDVSNKK